MKGLVFAERNLKEIIRDPMSAILGIGTPVGLITMISLIMKNIDGAVDIFSIRQLVPTMTVFGLSFLSLFLGSLMVSDRSTSYILRLFTSPMKSVDYVSGYLLSVIPVGVVQIIACFIIATIFGLDFTVNTLYAMAVLMPTALLFMGVGLLMGGLFSSNGLINGVGTVIVAGSIFFSGGIIPLDVIGGTFKKICYYLPFAHSNDAVKLALAGDFGELLPHLLWVFIYSILVFLAAIFVFKKKMKS